MPLRPRALGIPLAAQLACAPLLAVPEPVVTIEVVASGSDESFIQGAVRDPSRRQGIPGALVVLQCLCISGARELSTDDNGIFSFRDLPAGHYAVQVLLNHASFFRELDVTPGQRWRLRFSLDPDVRFPPPVT